MWCCQISLTKKNILDIRNNKSETLCIIEVNLYFNFNNKIYYDRQNLNIYINTEKYHENFPYSLKIWRLSISLQINYWKWWYYIISLIGSYITLKEENDNNIKRFFKICLKLNFDIQGLICNTKY